MDGAIEQRLFDFARLMVDEHGENSQLMKAAEELGELQHELFKAHDGHTNVDKIAEEFGDVVVTLYQVKLMFDLSSAEIVDWMHYKIDRETERLKHGPLT